jgi:hypothetical protein
MEHPTTDSHPSSQHNKKRVLKIIIISILVVAAMFVTTVLSLIYFAWNMADAQTETAHAFITHLAEGEIADAYALTNEEFQLHTSEPQLFKFIKTYPIIQNAEAEFTATSIENGITTLSGTLTNPNGTEAPLTVWLEKYGEEWSISGLSLEKEDLLTIE